MEVEHEVVRLAVAYQQIWHRFFPDLFRRAQWHIIHYLCTAGRQGASAGEISGLVRQIFLLDDATVRERIVSLVRRDFCLLDPPTGNITARTIIFPTDVLLRRFDDHLVALIEPFAAAVSAIAPGASITAPAAIDLAQRTNLLRVIETFCESWRAAIDRVLASRDMSQARRHEAKRHLIAPSHWILVLIATRHRYDARDGGGGGGVLADRMAAQLIDVLGQNFQTTRDHINYLMEIGILERRGGRALHVALTPLAAEMLHEALGRTAAHWPAILRQMRAATTDQTVSASRESLEPEAEERTTRVPQERGRFADFSGHHLRIVRPPAARRHIPIAAVPLTIGRAAPSDLLLDGTNISRTHCRIEIIDGQICVTDLGSTNGTYVDGRMIGRTVPLHRGAIIEIGAYVIEYEHHRPAAPKPDAVATKAAAASIGRRRRA
jgi:hypothetical protein